MLDLSIVIPTCDRPEHLRLLLTSLREDLQCSHEIIVVSPPGDDQTPLVLEEAAQHFGPRLKIIREEKREGFVRAANKGFKAATARNLIWLNDDARPLPGTLDEAVRQIDAAPPDIAFLAMFHCYHSQKNIAYQAYHESRTFALCHVRGTLYANFPIGRRETYSDLNYFDEQFYFYAADPDLSLKAWHANLRIAPAYGCFIDHDEHQDDRRAEDADRGKADNAKLFAKWNLPDKNPHRNDFTPTNPNTLRGLRSSLTPSPCTQGNQRLSEAKSRPVGSRGEGSPEFPATSNTPKITFLLATHNRKTATLNTLNHLQSLEKPSHFHTQTIVVDNASTDGTPDSIATNHPAVTLIRQTKNQGACAKNAGLPIATGDFILFLDDDSYPDAPSIQNMIAHFQSNPRLGAAVFTVTLPDGSREASAFPTVCIGCGTAFRREALLATGGLPNDFFMQAEEYDLSLRLLDAGWDIQRFDDLEVTHLKTKTARQPTRTTRLDIRNNLLVISRNFPRKWILPYAIDWIRRYHWLAATKGTKHRLAFYRGLIEGLAKSLIPFRRAVASSLLSPPLVLRGRVRVGASRPSHWLSDFPVIPTRRAISEGAFEKFAMINRIRSEMSQAIRQDKIQSILLIDVSKNLYAHWLAARELNLRIVAIADENLAQPGRHYRGIPILDDQSAQALIFDAAIIANTSPVQALSRHTQWTTMSHRPIINLHSTPIPPSLAA